MKFSHAATAFLVALIALPAGIAQQPQKPKFSVFPEPVIPLWPNGAPLATGTTEKDKPQLTVFLPKKQISKTAVLILPGGGYVHLATALEGSEFAEWFNAMGIPAFVLEYRLTPYHHPAELLDAARALRYIRSHAEEYKIAPERIGILGSSAGGHLAATLSTHFDAGNPKATDPIDRVSDRPNFAVLLYPVIGPIGPAAAGSFVNLLGEKPDPALLEELSNDKKVTKETPPTFLALADDDSVVWPENSIRYYQALHQAGVSAELHIYQRGGHGFGSAWLDPVPGQWRQSLNIWLEARGLLY